MVEGGVGSRISGSDEVYKRHTALVLRPTPIYYYYYYGTILFVYMYILHRDRLNAIRLKGKRGG